MWRPRSLLLLGLAVLGVLAFAGLALAAGAPSASAPGTEGGCDAHYHPWNVTISAGCSVPGSQYCLDLSSIDLGKYCWNTIDLNPADWLGYLSCEIVNEARTIWNAIVGYLTTFLENLASGLVSAFETPINDAISAVQSAVDDVLGAITGFFNGISSAISNEAANFGPFAPIVIVALSGAIILGAIVAVWVVLVIAIAAFKTGFNLL